MLNKLLKEVMWYGTKSVRSGKSVRGSHYLFVAMEKETPSQKRELTKLI